ncbi:MAG: hypothetical protein GTN86_08920 [Xanthomonadales bacterium]|nr:hypothetical protein [Xanthomonadales bacterium]NIN60006.1 hypothetical protein [Xanthomonadales bacterium]NIN75374.1 hypothetical protein [Xanthomonadales bacterium]NIO14197.1 hypothetical protein [Xanthomonadales bacterium]NIP12399.1 hypothetical protein [Xanthomonadales bacterium]
MGTFSRIRYVIAANLNALIEKAEDPEKLLRALIREMEDASEDARLAAADLLAEQQQTDRTADRLRTELAEWEERAEKAVAVGREDLARAALRAKQELNEQLQARQDEQALLQERIARLEQDMTTLKAKLAEAKSRLKAMLRRDAPTPVPPREDRRLSANERKLRQAMGRFDRLQSQVERLEARVRSYEVGGFAPPAWQAEAAADDPAIEAELEALRARVAGSAASPSAAEANEA